MEGDLLRFYRYSPVPVLKRAKDKKRSKVKLDCKKGCRSSGAPGLSIRRFNCESSSLNTLSNSESSLSSIEGTLATEKSCKRDCN